MHLFKYSKRPGTAAENLQPLDPRIIEERFRRLSEVAQQNADKYRLARMQENIPLELIIESIDEDGRLTATSREHITISWGVDDNPFSNAKVGDIVKYKEGSAHECPDSHTP
jgi:tRNA A37 methylthiotransferase MiaB